MSRIREIRAKQERIARQIENEKRVTPAPLPTPVSIPGGPPVPIITGVPMLAKNREASSDCATGVMRARLMNQFRTPYGETYDCFAFPGQDASDLADFLPSFSSSDAICIKRLIDGNWYIDQPDFILASDCT